jgi:UPF0755 protein
MARFFKKIIILAIIIFIISGLAYWRGINISANKEGDDVYFIIAEGESVGRIGGNLHKAFLIKSKNYFKIYVRLNGYQRDLQAGEYLLSPALNIKEIVNALAAGQSLSQERTIKVIEGWDMDDINKYLLENNFVSGDEFKQAANKEIGNWKPARPAGGLVIGNLDFLDDAPPQADLEGYLFPDTYRVYKDASAEDIIEKMLANFDMKLTNEMREEIAKKDKTIYEIIIMASLLEKEVRSYKDMKVVSGIFWDRIKNGQPLEACATLAYVLGENKKQYTVEDTNINSPYNTYQNQGLPPGPICNPGLNAIRAAIYPDFTKYNYFLSSFNNGETIFSQTYEEHIRNKAKYLK